MILTKSNVLPSASPVVTTGASTDLPNNIVDPDFSTLYTSSDSSRLTIDFGILTNITYVAVAGINIGANDEFFRRVRIYDGEELIQSINVIRNQVVLFQFEARSFTNLRVSLFNESEDKNPSVRYIAAGVHFTAPNGGEQSGYNRQFLARSYKNSTTLNGQAAPVAMLRTRTQQKGTLTLPNMTRAFSEGEWQDFLDFAESNHFFISEQTAVLPSTFSGSNPSSYLCYDVTTNKVTAHAQTRSLNNISISFKVYTGL